MSEIAVNSSKKAAFCMEKRAPLIMHAAILIFFVMLYWLMTMTGEDISQFTTYNQCSTIDTIKATYRYLPRIGEFYHNLVIRCYEPVARINLCLAPRLIDACLAATLLYALAWLAFLRRHLPYAENKFIGTNGSIKRADHLCCYCESGYVVWIYSL